LKKESFQFGPFCLDVTDHLLLRGNDPISLAPKAFDTLLYLAKNSRRLVTREELIKAVWPNSFVEDGSLSVNISSVRRALGEMDDGGAYIETVPKKGYRFRSDVTLLAEDAADDEPANPAKRSRTKFLGSFMAAAVLALAAFIIYMAAGGGKRAAAFASMKISRLTSAGEIAGAAISPDARYVAYPLNEAEGQSLWIRPIASPSGTRILAPGGGDISSLTFSPDGNNLYYVWADENGARALYRMPFAGGDSSKVLGGVTGPISFSPDGKQFAFVLVNPARSQAALMVANADGSGLRQVTIRKRPQYLSRNGLSWLADGRSIACFAGSAADYFGQAFHLVRLRVSDGAEIGITSKAWAWPGPIVSSPDGKALLAAASEQVENALQIWRISLAGGAVSAVTNDLSDYAALSLSSDGKTLAAVKSDNYARLWTAPPNDFNRAVPVSPSDLQNLNDIGWTHDDRIAYSARTGDYLSIFLLDPHGHNPKQLTLDRGNRIESSITRDGRYLIFQLGGKIWRMDLDGANQHQLTQGVHDVHPSPSADGRSLVYASFANWSPAIGGKPTLWVVSIDGGKPRQLTDMATSFPRVSPDGKQIACAYFPGEDPRFSQNKIAVFDFNGDRPVKVFDRPSTAGEAVYWAPDGKALDYIANIGGVGNIWRQALSGGAPVQLTHFREDQLFDFAWSPGGGQLAIARGRTISDVVLMKDSTE
jgi:Tol biopolymer transport system component/DNA-binding winged helix-turn-helix (wHTH) protein